MAGWKKKKKNEPDIPEQETPQEKYNRITKKKPGTHITLPPKAEQQYTLAAVDTNVMTVRADRFHFNLTTHEKVVVADALGTHYVLQGPLRMQTLNPATITDGVFVGDNKQPIITYPTPPRFEVRNNADFINMDRYRGVWQHEDPIQQGVVIDLDSED